MLQIEALLNSKKLIKILLTSYIKKNGVMNVEERHDEVKANTQEKDTVDYEFGSFHFSVRCSYVAEETISDAVGDLMKVKAERMFR